MLNRNLLQNGNMFAVRSSCSEIPNNCNFLQFNTLHGATPHVQWFIPCLDDDAHPLPSPNQIGGWRLQSSCAQRPCELSKASGVFLLTCSNLAKFQPSDFKALTHIFNASFPSFRPYSMFGMLSHSRASLTFSISHHAECDSACTAVQTCLDDDRPPYCEGHASVQEWVLRLGHLGQQSPRTLFVVDSQSSSSQPPHSQGAGRG